MKKSTLLYAAFIVLRKLINNKSVLFGVAIIGALIVANGCRQKNGTVSFTRDDFPKSFTLSNPMQVKLEIDSITYPYVHTVLRDSLVFVNNRGYDRSFIDVYSLTDGHFMFHLAPRGRGPGEFTRAGIGLDTGDENILYIDDGRNKYTIDLDSTLLKRQVHIINNFMYYRANETHLYTNIAILNDHEFVAYNLWFVDDHGFNNGIPPLKKYSRDKIEAEQEQNYKYFPGPVNTVRLIQSPKKDMIWLADSHRPQIKIYNGSLELVRIINGPDNYTPIVVELPTPELIMLVFQNDEEYSSYSSYAFTDKYIYIIYQGIRGVNYYALYGVDELDGSDGLPQMELPPSEIFQFTWDGRPVARYQLDRYAQSISLSKDEKSIYVSSVTKMDDEAVLYRYDLF